MWACHESIDWIFSGDGSHPKILWLLLWFRNLNGVSSFNQEATRLALFLKLKRIGDRVGIDEARFDTRNSRDASAAEYVFLSSDDPDRR